VPLSTQPYNVRDAAPFRATGATPAANTAPTYTPDANRIELIRTVRTHLTISGTGHVPALVITLDGTEVARSKNWSSLGSAFGQTICWFVAAATVQTNQAVVMNAPLPNDLLLTENDALDIAWLATPATFTMTAFTVSGIRWITG